MALGPKYYRVSRDASTSSQSASSPEVSGATSRVAAPGPPLISVANAHASWDSPPSRSHCPLRGFNQNANCTLCESLQRRISIGCPLSRHRAEREQSKDDPRDEFQISHVAKDPAKDAARKKTTGQVGLLAWVSNG